MRAWTIRWTAQAVVVRALEVSPGGSSLVKDVLLSIDSMYLRVEQWKRAS